MRRVMRVTMLNLRVMASRNEETQQFKAIEMRYDETIRHTHIHHYAFNTYNRTQT
jgi:hypothetical protein